MKNLILALQIFSKYTYEMYVTGSERDVLHVYIDSDLVSDEDKTTLKELGFDANEEDSNLLFVQIRFNIKKESK